MRDVFYTILVVWILWRVLNSISTYSAKRGNDVKKKKMSDDQGEYVDYEEIK